MPGNFEPVSSVDSAWLAMEQPTNLMMMSGIITFREPIQLAQLRVVIEERWLVQVYPAYTDYRQRAGRFWPKF